MPTDVDLDRTEKAMLAIGGSVGLSALFVPTVLQRVFGIPSDQLTGAGSVGWRLFGARNVYLCARALTGHPDGIAAFGPLQALDQAVFWHAWSTRAVPRPTPLAAALASASLVVLDVHRRRGAR